MTMTGKAASEQAEKAICKNCGLPIYRTQWGGQPGHGGVLTGGFKGWVHDHGERMSHVLACALGAEPQEEAEPETNPLREALERVRHELDAETNPDRDTGWERANAVIDAALSPSTEDPGG